MTHEYIYLFILSYQAFGPVYYIAWKQKKKLNQTLEKSSFKVFIFSFKKLTGILIFCWSSCRGSKLGSLSTRLLSSCRRPRSASCSALVHCRFHRISVFRNTLKKISFTHWKTATFSQLELGRYSGAIFRDILFFVIMVCGLCYTLLWHRPFNKLHTSYETLGFRYLLLQQDWKQQAL